MHKPQINRGNISIINTFKLLKMKKLPLLYRFTALPLYRFTALPLYRFMLLFLAAHAIGFSPNFSLAQQNMPCPYPGGATLCEQFGSEPVEISITTPTLTSSLSASSWSVNTVFIGATLTVDSPFLIENSTIILGPNGRIVIVTGGEFRSLESRYFTCNSAGWEGVRAEGGYTQFTSNNIEDAQNAITIANSDAFLIITRNNFNRNRVDISVPASVTANALIAGNFFDATSTNFLGLAPEAGISATEAFVTVGLPFTNDVKDRNTFRNHRFGASNSGAVMNFRYATFECNQFGILSVLGRTDIRGSGGFRNLFTREQSFDIRFPQSSLYVYNSDFNQCQGDNLNSQSNMLGEIVEVVGPNLFEIDNNSGVQDNKVGINIERSSGGSGFVVRNRIDGNVFVIHPFVPQSSRRAIKVEGSPGTTDIMRLWSNFVNVNSGGSTEAAPIASPIIEVGVRTAPNYNLRFNYIYTTNPDLVNHRNRWGFYIRSWQSPSAGNWFSDNHVTGNNATFDHGMCAFHFIDSGPWNICDNSADYTLRGFHLTGNCATSVFGGNNFGHHARSSLPSATPETAALQMEAGSIIGPQFCRHNIWELANYTPDRAAWHKGNNFPASRFDYNPSLIGEEPVPAFPASGWFHPDCTGNPLPNQHCGEQEPYSPTLDEFESQIISENQNYSAPATVLAWEERRQVISKLLRYPDLNASYPAANTFYNTHINTSAGKFAQFDEMLHNAMLIDSSLMASLDNIRAQITNVIGRIDSLDSTIPNALAAESLGNLFFTYRSTLINPIGQLMSQQQGFESQILASRTNALALCEQYLATLPQSATYEWNQTFLNGLAIKKAQVIALSENDLSTLRIIAGQCPEIAGHTRDQAMGLLPIGDPAIFLPDVPIIPGCHGLYGEGDERNTPSTQHSLDLQLSPNPVPDALFVRFSTPFSGDIQVFDLAGKSAGRYQGIKEQTEVNISTSKLAPGIFFLSLVSDSGKRTVTKFIVSK